MAYKLHSTPFRCTVARTKPTRISFTFNSTQLRCANNKTHSRKPSAICSLCEPKTHCSPFSRNSGGILWKA
ncbi:hypothetical protein QQG55_42090 [Brugia pahangi]